MKTKTAWSESAKWYDEHLREESTYHERIVIPGVLKLLAPKRGERVLDVACGQGQLAAELLKHGASVVGIDAAKPLIDIARKNVPDATFYISDAKRLAPLRPDTFDAITCVLAIQNIDKIEPVFAEMARVLVHGGRAVLVMTHPCFRIQRQSAWGWDEERKLQYRRIDGYLSEMKIPIVMHPGKAQSPTTLTFHRPLQHYVAAFAAAGFALDGLEEWVSDKVSTKGSHASAENHSRKEIPLFLALRLRKL